MRDWSVIGLFASDFHFSNARSLETAFPFELIEGRTYEAAQKIYFPAVHPREPYATGRGAKRSPFHEREKELGGFLPDTPVPNAVVYWMLFTPVVVS